MLPTRATALRKFQLWAVFTFSVTFYSPLNLAYLTMQEDALCTMQAISVFFKGCVKMNITASQ